MLINPYNEEPEQPRPFAVFCNDLRKAAEALAYTTSPAPDLATNDNTLKAHNSAELQKAINASELPTLRRK